MPQNKIFRGSAVLKNIFKCQYHASQSSKTLKGQNVFIHECSFSIFAIYVCTIPIFLPTHQMAPKHFTSSSVLKWCFWNAILGKSLPNEAHTKKSHLSCKSRNILSIWRCKKYGVLEVKGKWICTLKITRKLKTPFHISKYHPELLKCSFTATAKQCRTIG